MWARQEQPILTLSANFVRRGDSLLVVGQGLLLPPAVGPGCLLHPFAACSAAGEQRNILSPRQAPPVRRRVRSETCLRAQRSALRLFLHRASRDCAAIACWWWGKVATSIHSPPVRRRVNRGTSSLCAPAVFAPCFARLRGDSRAGKKITFPQKRKSQKEAPDTAWGRNTAPWVLSQQDKPSRMDTMAQFTLSHMILIIVPCRDNGVNTTRNVAPRRIFCIFVSTFGQYVKRPGSGSRRTQNSAAPDPAHDPILLISSNLLVDVFI